jgi:hypothetical protein
VLILMISCLGWRPQLGILKTSAQEKHNFFFWTGVEVTLCVTVGVLNQEWHSHKMEVIDGVQTLHCSCHAWQKTGRVCHALSSHCILAFALQLRKSHRKTTVRVARKCWGKQCWARCIVSIWSSFYRQPWLACWPHSHLACASGDLGQPSSVQVCARWQTKGFPQLITLS